MRGVVACLALVTGCGRIAFDERTDAAADGSLGPFGPALPVVELNTGAVNIIDDDPSLTADMLEIYFNSDRTGVGDIYRSTRASTSVAWSAPQRVAELSGVTSAENTPHVAGDGLTFYMVTTTLGTSDVYVSTRATRADSWSSPALVAELSSSMAEAGIHVSADGLTAYLNVDAGPGMIQTAELYRASRASTAATWSTPTLISELAMAEMDTDPFVTPDDRLIYWTSGRGGNIDIWTASRPASGVPFGNLQVVQDLATAEEDTDVWLSPDGRTLYFARGTTSTKSIYMATR